MANFFHFLRHIRSTQYQNGTFHLRIRPKILRAFASVSPSPAASVTASSQQSRSNIMQSSTAAALQTEEELKSPQLHPRLEPLFEAQKKLIGKRKTNRDLLRAQLVFGCCQSDWVIRNNQKLLWLSRKLLGKRLFDSLMRATFYGHFVAGETAEEVTKTVTNLQNFGINSIIQYSVEANMDEEEESTRKVAAKLPLVPQASPIVHKSVAEMVEYTRGRFSVPNESLLGFNDGTQAYNGDSACDRNAEMFCKCIDYAAEATQGQGFTAIKVTALGRPRLLMRLTETITQVENLYKVLTESTWENVAFARIDEEKLLDRLKTLDIKADTKAVREWFKQADFDQDGFVDFFDWGRLIDVEADKLHTFFQVSNIKTGELEPIINHLSERERHELNNMMIRLMKVADHSVSRGIRLLVDAEQTYFQLAISRLTVALMRRYNRDQAFVQNTYQAYLKSTKPNLIIDLQRARRENFYFGCKLVRGAYMNQESLRAASMGYEDPINPSAEATSENYHQCLDLIIGEWALRGENKVALMTASHNVKSVQYAVDLMNHYGIAPNDRVICFGQSYGIHDWIAFTLAQQGYSVYKCLPYGPIENVLPYLSRRALENGALLRNIGRERRLMWQEMKRRLLGADLLVSAKDTHRLEQQR